jgi:hypothetical protein
VTDFTLQMHGRSDLGIPIGHGISGANGCPQSNDTCQDKTLEVEIHTTSPILHGFKSRSVHFELEDRGCRSMFPV